MVSRCGWVKEDVLCSDRVGEILAYLFRPRLTLDKEGEFVLLTPALPVSSKQSVYHLIRQLKVCGFTVEVS